MDMKKLWPSLAALVGILLSTFAEPIGAFVTAHPVESLAVSNVLTIIANMTKSPTQS